MQKSKYAGNKSQHIGLWVKIEARGLSNNVGVGTGNGVASPRDANALQYSFSGIFFSDGILLRIPSGTLRMKELFTI